MLRTFPEIMMSASATTCAEVNTVEVSNIAQTVKSIDLRFLPHAFVA